MSRKKVAPKRKQILKIMPLKVDEHERETIIMFVDIMGASEVSNHKGLKQYSEFVNKVQELFTHVCNKHTELYEQDREFIFHDARGDEGLLMFYRQTDQAGISADIDMAVHIALALKREWLCLEENRQRILNSGLLPINLAVGIHVGRTYLEKKSGKDMKSGVADREKVKVFKQAPDDHELGVRLALPSSPGCAGNHAGVGRGPVRISVPTRGSNCGKLRRRWW